MKNIISISLLLWLLSSSLVQGQIADGITYQAVALDEKGKEIAGHDINGMIIHSKAIGVRFSIISGSPDGEILYRETHSTYTDQFGLFSLIIGHGEISSDGKYQKINDINWGSDKLFLNVEIDIRNKGDFKSMGIQQMMAVPYAFHSLSSSSANVRYEDILNKPTTVSGYGITDGLSSISPAGGITNTNITNWNTAYNWGNHDGLYRPITYVPGWSEINSNPFVFSSLANGQLLKYNSTTAKWENWTPDYLTSFTESDPSFSTWNKSTGITITASQVSDFQTSVTNNAAVLANTAKNGYPSADASKLAGIQAEQR